MRNDLKKTKAELDAYLIACKLVLRELKHQELIPNNKIYEQFNKIDPKYDNIYNTKQINKLLKLLKRHLKKNRKKLNKFFLVDLIFILKAKLNDYNLINETKIEENTIKKLLKSFDISATEQINKFLENLIWEYYILSERNYNMNNEINKNKKEFQSKTSLLEIRKKIRSEKNMNKELSAYRMVAKQALKEWNGLTEEEALAKASSESLEELESQVFAQSSVNSAINYIGEYFKKADLPLESDQIDTQIIQMKEDVYNQNGSSKTLETIGNIIKLDYKDETADFVINTLEAIHNNWVQDNQSSKTIAKKESQNKEYQYLPIELIGWNEAKLDLLFLNPILEKMKIVNQEAELEIAYNKKQKAYLKNHNISDEQALKEEIAKGSSFYSQLEPEMSQKFQNSEVIKKVLEEIEIKNPLLFENVKNQIK